MLAFIVSVASGYFQHKDSIGQAGISSDTEQRSLRAYLLLDTEMAFNGPKIVASEPLRINIIFKNSGLTPAYRVVHHAWLAAGTGLPDDFDYSGSDPLAKRDEAAIPNGGTLKFYVSSENPITKDQINTIIDGTIRIYIYGSILYYDIFGRQHFTNFCVWTNGKQPGDGAQMNTCPSHNDAG